MPETLEPIAATPAVTPELTTKRPIKARAIVVIVTVILAVILAAGIVLIHQRAKTAPTASPDHFTWGQVYNTGSGVAISISRPISDGNGHITAYLTENNTGRHVYGLTGQYVRSGSQTMRVPSLPFAALYPQRKVTYELRLDDTSDPVIALHPDRNNYHAIPVTWGN